MSQDKEELRAFLEKQFSNVLLFSKGMSKNPQNNKFSKDTD